jgi:mandelate racemase
MNHVGIPALKLRSISATAVTLPMKRPLGTSAQRIVDASLLLVDLQTEEGPEGHAYAFCYLPSIARSLVPVVQELGNVLAGAPLVPLDLAQSINRYFKLPGVAGPLAMVASSIDTAVWDALAVAAGVPLATLLGSRPRPIPAYNSNGLGLMSPEEVAHEAEELLEGGFRGIKLRLGRPDFAADLATVRLVRKRLPDNVHVMVDFNQALTFAQGMECCLALDQEGVYWIEEPIRHDDYHHLALIAQAVKTPIQFGENFTGLQPMVAALASSSSDFVMLDLDRIGGVTGWQRASGIAAACNREISSHLFPEVSTHLLSASPNAHWLEYVDWAGPLLQEPLKIFDGMAMTSEQPGNGLRWDSSAVEKHRLT